jgi:hypothetical protein
MYPMSVGASFEEGSAQLYRLDWQPFPLLLELAGRFKLVGSAPIIRTFEPPLKPQLRDPDGAIRAPYYCSLGVGWCGQAAGTRLFG